MGRAHGAAIATGISQPHEALLLSKIGMLTKSVSGWTFFVHNQHNRQAKEWLSGKNHFLPLNSSSFF